MGNPGKNGFTNCIDNHSGNEGNVRLQDDKYPEVFLHGQWSPICGHSFQGNNIGATLFCQKLNPEFKSGIVKNTNMELKTDALRVGKCLKGDSWLECTGGCNELGIGSNCLHNVNAKCAAGDMANIEIECRTGKF